MATGRFSTPQHRVVFCEKWRRAGLEQLAAEKEFTWYGGQVMRQRQALPWVRIDKKYRFDTENNARREFIKSAVYSALFVAPGCARLPALSGSRFSASGSVNENRTLEAWKATNVKVSETTIFSRRGGAGPPLLLLHGFPETHLMWHAVAPMLAETFTVICADLRGYGASGKPASSTDHAPYAKRAMARDMIELMGALGFARFAVAGHDRGGRVAYRMALDHPQHIERIAVLDIIPTSEAFQRADAKLALAYWPWILLAQPEPLPERLIGADPAAIVDDALANWGTRASSFQQHIRAAYIEALRDPQTVHAICEEFRAASIIDVATDARDQAAGRKIQCPLLALWGQGGPLDTWYAQSGGPLQIWSAWADNVSGRAIAGGHFFPEQNAAETAAALRSFFITSRG